jgi:hypothetical protein
MMSNGINFKHLERLVVYNSKRKNALREKNSNILLWFTIVGLVIILLAI